MVTRVASSGSMDNWIGSSGSNTHTHTLTITDQWTIGLETMAGWSRGLEAMGRWSIGLEAVANQLYGRLAGACGDGGLVDWPGAGGWDLAGCWLRAGAFNVRRMLRLVCHLRSPWPPFSTNAWADLLAWRGGVLPAFSALQQPSALFSSLQQPSAALRAQPACPPQTPP